MKPLHTFAIVTQATYFFVQPSPRYAPFVSQIAKIIDANRLAVLAVMPARGKEDSGGDGSEDEFQLTKKLATLGFNASVKIHQELTDDSNQTVLNRDPFVMYKVYFPNTSLKQAFVENLWCNSSAIRFGRVPSARLVQDSELHSVQTDASTSEDRERMRIVAATRAAQRGIGASESLLTSLAQGLTDNPLSELQVIDLHAHNGDTAVAICKLRAEGKITCRLLYLSVSLDGKNGVSNEYTLKRVAQWLATKWLNGSINLYKVDDQGLSGSEREVQKFRWQ